MRLTARQQHELRAAFKRRFGDDARLFVFGSRVDDGARGGDYDFLIQTEEGDASRLVDARLAFLADLHATPAFEGEKLDVVLYSLPLYPEPLPIHREAIAQGIEIE